MSLRTGLILLALMVSAAPLAVWADAPDAKGLEFFETKIRPILVEHCDRCHSAEAEAKNKLRGGLRLDTRDGLLHGGDTGPAVVPGKADESLLIDVLRYDDAVQMPPKGKLPDSVVADFVTWVNMGAPDPRSSPASTAKPARGGIDLDQGRTHWAYRPIEAKPAPEVKQKDWPRDDIDRFLLAKLEESHLSPVADADRATLARRLYFDLIGLPPTPREIDAFVNDPSPNAVESLVDRLLNSPQFGERWGRHWLDVARFAESLTLRGLIFKEAWRYRDYVIDSFNEDRPYDQFVREQIAGDLLPAADMAERRRQLIATTFLTLGNNNLEEQDKPQLDMDVVDEQLDTIGKTFLAQTIGCARCHDHKFDPIPTKDYYAMAGILRNASMLKHSNVSNWVEQPLPVLPDQESAIKRHEQEVSALERQVKDERARLAALGKGKAVKGAISAGALPGVVVDDSSAKKVGEWKDSQFTGSYIGAGYIHDLNADKGEKSLTFEPEHLEPGAYELWLAYSPGGGRSPAVPVTVFCADGDQPVTVNMRKDPPIDGRFVSLGRFRFEQDGQKYVLISNEGTTGFVTADAVVFIPVDQAGQVAANRATRSPGQDEEAGKLKSLEAELKQLRSDGPFRDMVMSVVEAPEIKETRIHVRGSVHSLGAPAPRGVLQVATLGSAPEMPSDQSGRRELAAWLAGEGNPLTARVIVNRTWSWLFGTGIVSTPDNFGTTGEPPSHPELLDTLAARFSEEGWSIKGLVRRIVLSRAYQLATIDDPKALAADPENRLHWRMNRRRLDAECIRDTMLKVGGQLDLTMGGRTFPRELSADYAFPQTSPRRSVYAPVFRNALPDLFEAFDFADPSMVVGRRDVSTVAPQALFLMNHPFVMDQARQAARRLLAEPDLDADDARLVRAYRLTLGRPPSAAERRIGLDFISQDVGETSEETWTALFQTLFASLDFRYVN